MLLQASPVFCATFASPSPEAWSWGHPREHGQLTAAANTGLRPHSMGFPDSDLTPPGPARSHRTEDVGRARGFGKSEALPTDGGGDREASRAEGRTHRPRGRLR